MKYQLRCHQCTWRGYSENEDAALEACRHHEADHQGHTTYLRLGGAEDATQGLTSEGDEP